MAREVSQFKAGRSGNPRGRPKVDFYLRDACREHTDLAVRTLVNVLKNKKAFASDKIAAAKELLQRGYGRPVQSVALSGGEDENGNALPIEIRTMSDLTLTAEVRKIISKEG